METKSLTKSLRETLAVFDGEGVPWTTTEVADQLELGRRSTYDRLDRLAAQGWLETKKVGANARVWWRPISESTAPTEALETVTDSIDVGIIVLDEQLDVAWANGTVAQYFGVDRRELGQQDGQQAIAQQLAPTVSDPDRFRETVGQSGTKAGETFRITDGTAREERWVEHESSLIETGQYAGGRVELFYDITEQHQSSQVFERQLRETNAFVESILDSQLDIIYAFDTSGNLLRYNDRLKERSGYSDGELAALDPTDFVAEEAATKAMQAFNRVIEHGESIRVELPLETATGETAAHEVTGSPITAEDGTVIGVAGVARDISTRKTREKQLKRQHEEITEEFEEIFSRIDDAFFALDDEFRFTYINDEATELLQQQKETLLGRNVWDMFPEAAETEIWDAYHTAMEHQEPTSFELYYEPLEFWIDAKAYPSETGLSVYFRDETERKEREQDLERYEQIVETVEDGIYAANADGEFTFVNSELASMLGSTPESMVGTPISEIVGDDIAARGAEIQEALQSGPENAVTVEVTLPDGEGGHFDAETTVALLSASEGDQRVGVVRDITERKDRERKLKKQIRAQDVITDLGQYALEQENVDALMARAAELVAETLDNDYCKVLDLSLEENQLLVRQGVGWQDGVAGTATVSSVEDDSQAAYTLGTEQPVVVENLATDARFSGPELLTSHDVTSGISVIIGSFDELWGILGTHDTEPKQFTQRDVNFVQSVANILATAINRAENEQVLRRQREELAALDSINEVVQGITGSVIEQSTREAIEQTVCERLADSDSYLFAWIGEVETASQRVAARAEAETGEYLDDITISVDPDDEHSDEPTGRAFNTGEPQFVHDIQRESKYEPWREKASGRGVRSSAAIPINHGNTVYAVLNVYSDRPYAFGGRERSVISQLGEIIGHAIAANERKRALMSDELVELEFHMPNVFDALGLSVPSTGTITFEELVPIADDEYLLYGTTTPDARESLEAMAAVREYWTERSMTESGDEYRFELKLSDPPVLSELASLGGSIADAFIKDGDYQITIHLSPSTDSGQIIDTILDTYPNAEMVARRQIEASDDHSVQILQILDEQLTDRQSAALRSAYHAGYYEWPRQAAAETVADSLEIAPATFSQHLRKAEKKVFDGLFAEAERVT